MAAPLLDNQFIGHNFLVKKLAEDRQTVEDAAKDIINSIAERDIYTGDNVELCMVDSTGVHYKKEACRRD
jgi:20S proteasome alpha/beta subunit